MITTRCIDYDDLQGMALRQPVRFGGMTLPVSGAVVASVVDVSSPPSVPGGVNLAGLTSGTVGSHSEKKRRSHSSSVAPVTLAI